ncbi:MAG: hypothetical protein IIB23_01550 [Chloroflexi bacterium]|nr:hypothetical protein [Chloroflexota bacterium]
MSELPTGPFIQAALFAEVILEDKTGTLSVIRIIDRFTHVVQGQSPPENLPPFTRQLNTLISLKPGKAMGRQDFTLTMEKPDTHREAVAQGSFNFAGGRNQGVNLRLVLHVTIDQEGIYFFDFEIDEHILTRMPLEVIYQRVVATGQPPEAP